MAAQRRAWPIGGAIASLAGIAATVVQIVERIALAEDPQSRLACNISELISCTDVLLAPQASVFGPIPNAAFGLLMFSVFLAAFTVAASRTSISKGFARGMQFLMLLMFAFVTWFMWQTAYVIGALCLHCTVIATAAVLANLAWWKVWHRRHGHASLLAFGAWTLLAAFVFYGLWT